MEFIQNIFGMILGFIQNIFGGLGNVFGGLFGNLFGNNQNQQPQATENTQGLSPALYSPSQQQAPTLVSNQPSTGSPNQAQTSLVNSSGQSPLVMLDVGHSGNVLLNGQAMTREQLNNLTFAQLQQGLANNSIVIKGGAEPGAVAPSDNKTEFEHNFMQAIRTADEMRARGMRVDIYVSESDSIRARVDRANQVNADVAISFHNNAGGGEGSEYFYPHGDAASQRLAQSINQNMQASGNPSRGAKDETQTQHPRLGFFQNHNSDRLKILLEGFFMDNPTDYARSRDANWLNEYAGSVASSVEEQLLARGYSKDVTVPNNVTVSPSPVPTVPNAQPAVQRQ